MLILSYCVVQVGAKLQHADFLLIVFTSHWDSFTHSLISMSEEVIVALFSTHGNQGLQINALCYMSTFRNLTDTVAEVRACIYEAYEDHPDCVSHLDAQTEAISATIGNIWEQCEPLYSYSGIEGYEYESEFLLQRLFCPNFKADLTSWELTWKGKLYFQGDHFAFNQ